MNTKNTIFVIISILMINHKLLSQNTFQKTLPAKLDSALIRSAPDAKSVYVAGRSKENGQIRLRVMKLDEAGALIWHKSYYTTDDNFELNSIVALNDGVVAVVSRSNLSIDINGIVMKMDENDGSLVWSKLIGEKNRSKLFEIEKDDDNNLWLSAMHLARSGMDSTYYYLMQLQPNGKIIAAQQNKFRYFSNGKYESAKFENLTWNKNTQQFVCIENFQVPGAVSGIAIARQNFSIGFVNKTLSHDEYILNCYFDKIQCTKNKIAFSGWTYKDNILNKPPDKDSTIIGILDKNGKNHEISLRTYGLYEPIHSNNGDLIFYSPKDRLMIKYDDNLKVIWSKRLDNCVEMNNFGADIATDGSIYTVRNIGNRSIVSHILQDGSLNTCNTYSFNPIILSKKDLGFGRTYSPYGYPDFKPIEKDSFLLFTNESIVSNDFCTRLNASYMIPDTICLGEKLIPTQVDTLVGGKHFWRFDKNTDSDLTNPVFLPEKPGFKHLFHSVQNNVCLDTFSKLVYIQALPKITLNDTIVCGAPSITYQLANPLVKTYFLNNVQTKPEIRISQSGIYNIRFESAGCKVDKTIKVKIVNFDKPIVVPDTSNCFGISFRLGFNPLFSNILFDEIPTQDSITISDSNKHFYEATYSLDKDCVVKGEIKLSFKKCDEKPDIIFAPNAFSPNFDGINDVFQVYSNSEFEIQLLQIFDRWGSLIFETQQSPQQWNGDTRGKPAQIGVFVYQIRYRDLKTGDIKYKKGDFMLER